MPHAHDFRAHEVAINRAAMRGKLATSLCTRVLYSYAEYRPVFKSSCILRALRLYGPRKSRRVS
jgi:hypothetical protein